jgi:hypothetical protein
LYGSPHFSPSPKAGIIYKTQQEEIAMPEKSRDAFRAELAKLKPDQKTALSELLTTKAELMDLKKLQKVLGKREQLISYLQTARRYHGIRDTEREAYFAELLKRLETFKE